VATNFGRVKYGVAFTLVASWFFRDAVDVDLLAQLRTLEAPLLVVTPQHDALLLADELAELRGAIEAAQGELRIRELNHDLLAVAGRALLPEERSFYPARLPRLIADRERAAVELWAAAAGTQGWRGLSPAAFDEGAPLRQRLRAIVDQHVLPGAGLPVALALADVSEAQLAQLAAWTWWLPPEMSGTRELDVLAALVDRHDPAGDLNLAFLLDSVHDFGVLAGHPLDELLACYIDSQDPLGSIGASLSVNLLTGDMQVGNSEKWIHSFVADEHRRLIDKIHLSPQDADRQTLRLFLRAAGMAERLGESGQSLELWQDGVWRPLPPLPSWPTRPARPAKAAPAAPAATGEDPGGSSH
jgi:hypothetical protein